MAEEDEQERQPGETVGVYLSTKCGLRCDSDWVVCIAD